MNNFDKINNFDVGDLVEAVSTFSFPSGFIGIILKCSKWDKNYYKVKWFGFQDTFCHYQYLKKLV